MGQNPSSILYTYPAAVRVEQDYCPHEFLCPVVVSVAVAGKLAHWQAERAADSGFHHYLT